VAALEVVTPLFIPDRFTPIVQSEQLKPSCHIVWRKEKRMGVAFDRWRPVPNRSHRRRGRGAKTKAKVRRTDLSPRGVEARPQGDFDGSYKNFRTG